MIAATAANASAPTAVSFGLWSNIRIARPRSASRSTAARAPRRRDVSFCFELFLGTSLHLTGIMLGRQSGGRGKRGYIACRLGVRPQCYRRERQRQRYLHNSPLVELALNDQIAAMQRDKPFDDG